MSEREYSQTKSQELCHFCADFELCSLKSSAEHNLLHQPTFLRILFLNPKYRDHCVDYTQLKEEYAHLPQATAADEEAHYYHRILSQEENVDQPKASALAAPTLPAQAPTIPHSTPKPPTRRTTPRPRRTPLPPLPNRLETKPVRESESAPMLAIALLPPPSATPEKESSIYTELTSYLEDQKVPHHLFSTFHTWHHRLTQPGYFVGLLEVKAELLESEQEQPEGGSPEGRELATLFILLIQYVAQTQLLPFEKLLHQVLTTETA